MAQHDTARHSVAQHGTSWHKMAQHGTAWHSATKYDTLNYNAAQAIISVKDHHRSSAVLSASCAISCCAVSMIITAKHQRVLSIAGFDTTLPPTHHTEVSCSFRAMMGMILKLMMMMITAAKMKMGSTQQTATYNILLQGRAARLYSTMGPPHMGSGHPQTSSGQPQILMNLAPRILHQQSSW